MRDFDRYRFPVALGFPEICGFFVHLRSSATSHTPNPRSTVQPLCQRKARFYDSQIVERRKLALEILTAPDPSKG